jgi:hypothetical protein
VIIPIVLLLLALLVAILSPFKDRRLRRRPRRLPNPIDALESVLDAEDFWSRRDRRRKLK